MIYMYIKQIIMYENHTSIKKCKPHRNYFNKQMLLPYVLIFIDDKCLEQFYFDKFGRGGSKL